LVNYPTHWKRHEVDFLVSANILADSKGFRNNQYTSEIRNRLESRNLGFRWVPRHSLKYSKGKQENPFADSNEWESKLRIEGEHPRIGPLGSMRLMGDWTWRERTNQKGVTTRDKLIGEIGLARKFGKKYKLKVLYYWEKETTIAVDKDSDNSAHPGTPARPAELRKSFRVDAQAAPARWIDLSANAMWINSNDAKITKYSASLSLRIPKLKIPIKSFVTKENRELVGIRPQEVFTAETKLSFNIRKIRLVVSHKYIDETLLTEQYKYSEFLARVSRDFDIY